MPSDSAPPDSAVVVLDGYRYQLTHAHGDRALLSPAPGADHDRTSIVTASELVYEPAVDVWTLPGRLLAHAGPAGGGVTITNNEG